MSQPSHDPENYSLDEMLDRLKGKPNPNPADGELVTRADGSQALRVRKRKRRSHQPQREESKRRERSRAVFIGVALSLLMLAVLGVAGLLLYANSSFYRDGLSESLSSRLGAKVEFTEFRVSPVGANAKSATIVWPEGSGYFGKLELDTIKATVSPATMFGRSLSGALLRAQSGTLALQVPASGKRPEHSDFRLHFDRASIGKFDMVFGDPANPGFRVSESEGSLSDSGVSPETFYLGRGTFALAGWPALKIDRMAFMVKSPDLEITQCRLTDNAGNGRISLDGIVKAGDPGALSTLGVSVSRLRTVSITHPDCAGLVDICIDSCDVADSNYLAFRAGSPESAEMAVTFTASFSADNAEPGDRGDKAGTRGTESATIGRLPCLGQMSGLLGDDDYHKLRFNKATGVFRRKGGAYSFKDMYLEGKSYAMLKGDIIVAADGALSGTIKLGLPDARVKLSNNPKLMNLFNEVINDFRCATIKLGGTVSAPADDFGQQYSGVSSTVPDQDRAAPDGDWAPDEPVEPVDPGKAFEDLTNPSR